MVFCEKCGTENTASAKFCKSCGNGLQDNPISQPVKPPQTSIGFGHQPTGEELVLHCSLCGHQDFAKDSGRLDSKWGFTSFKVAILTCKRCGHVELFNKGRSIWDFD